MSHEACRRRSRRLQKAPQAGGSTGFPKTLLNGYSWHKDLLVLRGFMETDSPICLVCATFAVISSSAASYIFFKPAFHCGYRCFF